MHWGSSHTITGGVAGSGLLTVTRPFPIHCRCSPILSPILPARPVNTILALPCCSINVLLAATRDGGGGAVERQQDQMVTANDAITAGVEVRSVRTCFLLLFMHLNKIVNSMQ